MKTATPRAATLADTPGLPDVPVLSRGRARRLLYVALALLLPDLFTHSRCPLCGRGPHLIVGGGGSTSKISRHEGSVAYVRVIG